MEAAARRFVKHSVTSLDTKPTFGLECIVAVAVAVRRRKCTKRQAQRAVMELHMSTVSHLLGHVVT